MFANRVVNATVAALNMLAARVPTVALSIVVLANVELPVTNRFPVVNTPELVMEAEFKEVKAPLLAKKLVIVVLAKVDDPVAKTFVKLSEFAPIV